jgi:hypothetical protein
MSDGGYEGGGTTGGKCGCAMAALVGVPVLAILMFASFYGDCVPGERCRDNDDRRFVGIMVVVSVLASGSGLLTRYLINKRD